MTTFADAKKDISIQRGICMLGVQSIPKSDLLSNNEKIALLNEVEKGFTDILEEVRAVRSKLQKNGSL